MTNVPGDTYNKAHRTEWPGHLRICQAVAWSVIHKATVDGS